MNIRRAQTKDIDRIFDLLFQVQDIHAQGRPDIFKIGGRKYTEEDLKKIILNDKTPVFVYEDENGIVQGHCFCIYREVLPENTSLQSIRTLYIDDLCIDESARGMHIGQQLYEYVVEEARRTGCYRVTLHVWTCNPTARKFYEKMGLIPVQEELEYIL